jgi:hypothetical protein
MNLQVELPLPRAFSPSWGAFSRAAFEVPLALILSQRLDYLTRR